MCKTTQSHQCHDCTCSKCFVSEEFVSEAQGNGGKASQRWWDWSPTLEKGQDLTRWRQHSPILMVHSLTQHLCIISPPPIQGNLASRNTVGMQPEMWEWWTTKDSLGLKTEVEKHGWKGRTGSWNSQRGSWCPLYAAQEWPQALEECLIWPQAFRSTTPTQSYEMMEQRTEQGGRLEVMIFPKPDFTSPELPVSLIHNALVHCWALRGTRKRHIAPDMTENNRVTHKAVYVCCQNGEAPNQKPDGGKAVFYVERLQTSGIQITKLTLAHGKEQTKSESSISAVEKIDIITSSMQNDNN